MIQELSFCFALSVSRLAHSGISLALQINELERYQAVKFNFSDD